MTMYFELFFSFFQIGLFSFGGGMASMPHIQKQVVDKYQWFSVTEFTDLMTIVQITPGPIAINAAAFVGMQMAGVPGALVAAVGCAFPSCCIVLVLARLYTKYSKMHILQGALSGIRPAVVALIAGAGVTILILALWGEEPTQYGISTIDYNGFFIFILGLFILRKWKKVNSIQVMLGSGIAGGLLYYIYDLFYTIPLLLVVTFVTNGR